VPPRIPTDKQHSAGGVLWRPAAGGVEICLIATKNRTRWQLPKGHVDAGESEAQAAGREVREETGCAGEVGEDLGEISFWFFIGAGEARRRIRKSVRFFLVRYVDGRTEDHDAEVDEARWFDAAEAARALSFDSERRVVEKAIARLADASPRAKDA
jgi:8-oxo-dGTP diphosphatase